MRPTLRTLMALLVVLTSIAWPTPARANSNSFIDDDTSRFEPFIEAAKAEGLVDGCNPPHNTRVCPSDHITKGALALMLARAIGVPDSSTDRFRDDDGHFAEAAMNSLVDAGVRLGCAKGLVCPDSRVTREEMAAIFVAAFGWKQQAKPGQYTDLKGSRFPKETAEAARRGAILACDPPLNKRMCPTRKVRRDEALFALVSAAGLQPTANAGEDHDIPSLAFGDGFYELSLWDGRTPSARNRVSLTNGGYQGTALKVSIPKGSHFGADFRLRLADAVNKVPERLFFRYYLKLDRWWSTPTSGKLPGFSGDYGSTGKGGYRSTPSEPGWSARLMFSPTRDDGRVSLGYYVYHLGQEKRYGDGFGWNSAGKLQRGEWYCLEGEVNLNTPGMADGALRAWVDETPAFDLSGLQFRRPNEPEIKIESFWFDVYYGGKSVAPHNLALTIDDVIVDTHRVGCGGGGMSRSTEGDFDGNGYPDRVSWGDCAGGTCFTLEQSTWDGRKVVNRNGDGAWFNLDSHRLGLVGGDVDGDGRADVVYPGRCDVSTGCWRVHRAQTGHRHGENWGSGARFSPMTESLALGDWNGDGLDDLTYQGTCGKNDRPCWRVHTSSGSGFAKPRNWGAPPRLPVSPLAADITGDGRDDLIYTAPCDESRCWFAQISAKHGFKNPVALGPSTETADGGFQWIDFNGDARADLVSWVNSSDQSWIEVRFTRGKELSGPMTLTRPKRHIEDISMRRLDKRETVQLVLELRCGGGKTCIRQLMAPSPLQLVDSERFLALRLRRPGTPSIE